MYEGQAAVNLVKRRRPRLHELSQMFLPIETLLMN